MESYKSELKEDPEKVYLNVKSLTYRLFTEKGKTASHCSTGNPKLVLDTIVSWINVVKNREE